MLVIADATLADGRRQDVRIDRSAGTIDAVGRQLSGDDRLNAAGRLLLPGMVDVHVHFREPATPTRRPGRSAAGARPPG